MKGFVSNVSISVMSIVMALAAAYAILVPQDLALRGLGWVALALAAIALSVMAALKRSPRSVGQMLEGVERERAPVPVARKEAR